MIEGSPDSSQFEVSRVTHVMLIIVVAAAFVGFLAGIDFTFDRDKLPLLGEGSHVPVTGGGVGAMSYAEIRQTDLGPNSIWSSDFANLPRADADVLAEHIPDAAAKLASLEARASRRAFDGAPPVIPHRVDAASNANCVTCHAESVRVGNTTSRLMPHAIFANCQQCHAQSASPLLEAFTAPSNSFVGLPAPTGGDRAWDGAPPVIPHATFMRDNCLSCHGPTGDNGIRTPHAYQASCKQCHAPSAELDQRAFSGGQSFKGIEIPTASSDSERDQ